jgi:mRNA interferase RelE/StbE
VASCSLLIQASAAKELEGIEPKALRRQVVTRIDALADEPRPHGCEPLAGQGDLFRVRLGTCRIVYTIDDQRIVVMAVKAGQRRDVQRAR